MNNNIHNYNFDDNTIASMSNSDLLSTTNGWVVDRTFKVDYAYNHNPIYATDIEYCGHISHYNVFKKEKNNIVNTYITIYYTLAVDTGIYYFPQVMPLLYSGGTQFTKLLHNLGFQVELINCFEIDNLIGVPVKATLTHVEDRGAMVSKVFGHF